MTYKKCGCFLLRSENNYWDAGKITVKYRIYKKEAISKLNYFIALNYALRLVSYVCICVSKISGHFSSSPDCFIALFFNILLYIKVSCKHLEFKCALCRFHPHLSSRQRIQVNWTSSFSLRRIFWGFKGGTHKKYLLIYV